MAPTVACCETCRQDFPPKKAAQRFCSHACQLTAARLNGAGRPRTPAVDRFWKRVDKRGPDECWPWAGSRRRLGHGILDVFRDGTLRHVNAHRFSWELVNGAVPTGLHVLHRCDYPPCVNPAHLFLGTAAENQYDKRDKGRARNQNSGRLVCIRGHWILGENVAWVNGGKCRMCRICMEACQQRSRAKRRVRRLAARALIGSWVLP